MNCLSKKCFRCNRTKEHSEFYTHPAMKDGILGKCKECCRFGALEHRSKNLEKIREYDRTRRARNLDKIRENDRFRASYLHRIEARKKYEKTPSGIAAKKIANQRWSANNKIKINAAQKARRAVLSGKIKKQNCFCGEKAEAHHEDYLKPLDVTWLCDFHHKERHKELRELKRRNN